MVGPQARTEFSLNKEVNRDYLIIFERIALTRALDRLEPAMIGKVQQEGLNRGSEQEVYTWLDRADCRMMAQGLSDLTDPLKT